jgi:mannose-1-phosphate guanylyltransferase
MNPAPPVTIAVGMAREAIGTAARVRPMPFPVQTMILAAGRGTRLGGLGERIPKALVEIDGVPLLTRQLDYLTAHGVESVVLNASHLAGQIEEFVRSHEDGPATTVVVESEPLGTAGGVINALPHLNSAPLLVLYGDVICGEDLKPMSDLHDSEAPVATIAVYHSDQTEGKGVVEVEDSAVTNFYEKDPDRTAGWVNAGIYIVEVDWLARFTSGEFLDFGLDVFPAALRAKESIRAHRLRNPVIDVGTPQDLEKARAAGLPPLEI